MLSRLSQDLPLELDKIQISKIQKITGGSIRAKLQWSRSISVQTDESPIGNDLPMANCHRHVYKGLRLR